MSSTSPDPCIKTIPDPGKDIMELPRTQARNRYALVIQDYLTKWSFVFPMPDQKSPRIAKLLTVEVISVFGVPEALLTDRGTSDRGTLDRGQGRI